MLPRRSFLVASAALAACHPVRRAAAPVEERWTSRLGLGHPLVGRVWDVARAAFIAEADVAPRLADFPHVLLGEQHDNADHHRLQARLVASLGASRSSVVFEMIDRDRQADVEPSARDLDALPRALDWSKSGWPAFELYRPIFEAALAAKLPVVAGNLPRADAKAIAKGGTASASSAPWIVHMAALSDAARASLEEELRASHCGHLPETMVAGMSAAQVARDACLADAMATSRTSVLIAGAGHARSDRGVPFQLAARGEKSQSVAFVEVALGRARPDDYRERWGAATLPFDIVWFTPRASDDDPCRAFGGRK